jgi:hypothetical protein
VVMDIACCGLDCGACPAYHATERLTVERREAVADEWNATYGGNHVVADIDCVGCQHEGHHAPHCESMCGIRICAKARGIETCAECGDYACSQLADFFGMAPEAKVNLEDRRAN